MKTAIKSQLLYLKYDLQNRWLLSAFSLLFFIAIYVFFYVSRSEFLAASNFENLMIHNYMKLYLVIRMVITSISIPFEVLYTEYSVNNLILRQPIISAKVEGILFFRILFKIIKAALFNLVTFIPVMIAGGLASYIGNYLALMIPIFVGAVFVSSIGFFLSVILFSIDIKREFIPIIQIFLIILFVRTNGQENFFLPFTVISGRISEVLMSDIVYCELDTYCVFNIWWYWLIVLLIGLGLTLLIGYIGDILLHKKEYIKSFVLS